MMRPAMKAKLSILFGVIIGAVLLFLAFRNINFSELSRIYVGAKDIYLIPFAVCIGFEMLFRAARWKLLLSASDKVSLKDTFRLQVAGIALNNVLPMRLGEVARAAFGARMFSLPLVTVISTILVERALDTAVLFGMFGVAAYFGGFSGGFMKYDGYFWPLIAVLVAGIVALVFADEIISHRWFSGLFSRYPVLRKTMERLALGVKGFHSPKNTVLIILLACAQWSMDALNYYFMAKAFSIEASLDIFRSVALLFAGAVAASIPGMPGYFGNFEYAIAKVLSAWGVPQELGFAYATYTHVASYLIITVTGVFFVYQMGSSLSEIWGDFSRQQGENER